MGKMTLKDVHLDGYPKKADFYLCKLAVDLSDEPTGWDVRWWDPDATINTWYYRVRGQVDMRITHWCELPSKEDMSETDWDEQAQVAMKLCDDIHKLIDFLVSNDFTEEQRIDALAFGILCMFDGISGFTSEDIESIAEKTKNICISDYYYKAKDGRD